MFPSHSVTDLHALQAADSVICDLTFWTCKKAPDAAQQHALSKQALALVKQWDRIVEQDGVLYRKVFQPDGDEVLQLVLPSLPSSLLTQTRSWQWT